MGSTARSPNQIQHGIPHEERKEPMGTQTFPNGYAAILLASSAAGGHRGATKYLPLWDVLAP